MGETNQTPQRITAGQRVLVLAPAGHVIECYVQGQEHKRTAVLTSGIGCGPVFFDSIAAELARDHKVIYWNYRGHGGSTPLPPGAGYRIEDHAADLQTVVRTLAPHTAPLMLGFSMGVQVMVEWSRLFGKNARAFVMLLGMPHNPLHRTVALRQHAGRVLLTMASYGAPVLQLAQALTTRLVPTEPVYLLAKQRGWIRPACPRPEFFEFLDFISSVPLPALLATAAGIISHDARHVARGIKQPTLVVAAKHDVFVDAAEAEAMADALPNAEFELLPHASHACCLEHQSAIARRVRRFVDLHDTERRQDAA